MKSAIVKRSVVVAGHKTSVSLENEFWNGLREIADERDETFSEMIAKIDRDRQHANLANLSSAIRLFVLGFYRDHQSVREQPNLKLFEDAAAVAQ